MRRVHRGAFASSLLRSSLEGFSGLERSFVTDLLYGTLRRERYLEASLRPYLERPEKLPEDVHNALKLAAYELLLRQTPRAVVTHEWVGVVKSRYGRLAGLVNAVLRRLEPPGELPPAVRYSLPDWLFEDWQRLLGPEAALAAARDMSEAEPLWLLAYAPDARAVLEREGAEVKPGPLPDTLAARLAGSLAESEAFRRGLVQPQNPNSVAVARLLGATPGARVLDLASGHGVKAAQLAAQGCEVTGVEVDAGKIERARRNLSRLGLEIEHLQHDLRQPLPLAPAPFVLLDAPCSGTGTLRGNPEIRARLTPAAVAGLAELQQALLETAATTTQAGGRLLYAVCALTQAETTAQIAAFLDRHPEFALEAFETDLPAHHTPQGSFILPADGLDGFFIARLCRTNVGERQPGHLVS